MASNFDMNPEKFRNTFQAINHGTVMEAAARNLQKEMLRDAEAAARSAEGASRAVIDMQDLEQARSWWRAHRRLRRSRLPRVPQDEELEQIHRDRIAQMKARPPALAPRRTGWAAARASVLARRSFAASARAPAAQRFRFPRSRLSPRHARASRALTATRSAPHLCSVRRRSARR